MGAPDDHLHRLWVDKYWQFFLRPESPMTDMLRKALDVPVRAEFDNMPLKDVLEYLRDKGHGDFNFHVRGKAREDRPVTVKLKTPVPIGAVLQFLEDEHDIIFVLRDYGIVVVAADERIPPGAMRVIDFWKHGKSATPTPELKDKAKPGLIPPAESPPKDLIRGVIEKVDPKDPLLVQISIGSDAGITKGQTLEVYRLQPAPKYLGRVQIVQMTATTSIGRALSTNPLGMRAGDQVTSHLVEK
jgi:hypothetical protein